MSSSAPLLALKQITGAPPVTLSPLQQLMAAHLGTLTVFWIALWVGTAFVLFYMLYKEYRERR